MAFQIKWTLQAEKGLQKVIDFLEKEWTSKEILQLEKRTLSVIKIISENPEIYPKSEKYKFLHKAIVDKNNYLVYRIKQNSIEIINFRGTKQRPKH